MIRRRAQAGLAAALATVSCAAASGLERVETPLAIVTAPVTVVTECGRVELVDFQPAHAGAAEEALHEACGVMVSPAFQRGVEARSWSDRCWINPLARPRQVPGAEVYRSLREAALGFQLVEDQPRNAVATTSLTPKRIRIQPERFEGWLSADPGRRAALINTLVHEQTHLVPRPGGTSSFRYTDRGHLLPWCADGKLVSYGVGNLAERIWLERENLAMEA